MSSKRHSKGNTLSKNLLKMKFMQKTAERTELDQLESDAMIDQQYNDNLRKEGQKYVVDNSYLYVERLVFGRMSFKGMNPEIEKLMVEMNADKKEVKQEKDERSNETFDVNDQEMTQRYSELMGKRKRNRDNSNFSRKQERRHDKYKKIRQN